MNFSENKPFWESFILMYRSMPCLWNVKSKLYGNKEARNDAYQQLLVKCKTCYPDADLKFVRTKIESLRAGFRRELRDIQQANRNGTIYAPTLWYFDLLLFTKSQEDGQAGTSSNEFMEMFQEDDKSFIEHHFLFNEPPDNKVQSPSTPLSSGNAERSYRKKRCADKETLAGKKAKFFEAASAAFSCMASSPFEPFSKTVGVDIEAMDNHQRIIAQKLISDILFYGKLGKLTENSSLQLQCFSQNSSGENQVTSSPSVEVVSNSMNSSVKNEHSMF